SRAGPFPPQAAAARGADSGNQHAEIGHVLFALDTMKHPCVAELAPNQLIVGVFLVQHKEVRQKKTGEPYLSLILCDRTGELEAKMWDNAQEAMGLFERDDFIRVKGMLQTFQNRLQLTVHRLQAVPESEIDISDYLPASQRNREEMFAELRC